MNDLNKTFDKRAFYICLGVIILPFWKLHFNGSGFCYRYWEAKHWWCSVNGKVAEHRPSASTFRLILLTGPWMRQLRKQTALCKAGSFNWKRQASEKHWQMSIDFIIRAAIIVRDLLGPSSGGFLESSDSVSDWAQVKEGEQGSVFLHHCSRHILHGSYVMNIHVCSMSKATW